MMNELLLELSGPPGHTEARGVLVARGRSRGGGEKPCQREEVTTPHSSGAHLPSLALGRNQQCSRAREQAAEDTMFPGMVADLGEGTEARPSDWNLCKSGLRLVQGGGSPCLRLPPQYTGSQAPVCVCMCVCACIHVYACIRVCVSKEVSPFLFSGIFACENSPHVKMPGGQRGLAERKLGGSESRKTGFMAAFILGATEHFSCGPRSPEGFLLRARSLEAALYCPPCSLHTAQFQALPFPR